MISLHAILAWLFIITFDFSLPTRPASSAYASSQYMAVGKRGEYLAGKRKRARAHHSELCDASG